METLPGPAMNRFFHLAKLGADDPALAPPSPLHSHISHALHGSQPIQLNMSATFPGGVSDDLENLKPGEGGLREDVEAFEDCSFERLVDLVDALAPHLVQSFICLKKWWADRRGEQEAHACFPSIGS